MNVWDFTLKYDEDDECKFDEKNVINDISPFCKKWGFQLEVGEETGYRHYQGRISLKKKLRTKHQVMKLFKLVDKARWSITSNNNKRGKDFYNYTTKEYTRIAGPWTENDSKPAVMTIQMKKFLALDLLPYMEHILDTRAIFTWRTINLLYDEKGNSAKSMLDEYLEYKRWGTPIPPFQSYTDVMAWVCDRCNPSKLQAEVQLFTFDLPRSLKFSCKKEQAMFYAAIEDLKNGRAFDKRYNNNYRRFTRPNIWIFCNDLPNFDLLSRDKWKIWTLDDDKNLIDANHLKFPQDDIPEDFDP